MSWGGMARVEVPNGPVGSIWFYKRQRRQKKINDTIHNVKLGERKTEGKPILKIISI